RGEPFSAGSNLRPQPKEGHRFIARTKAYSFEAIARPLMVLTRIDHSINADSESQGTRWEAVKKDSI
ncbi:MAG: hypothetical protein ABGY05_03935, partial [Pseudomonadota bacterium]